MPHNFKDIREVRQWIKDVENLTQAILWVCSVHKDKFDQILNAASEKWFKEQTWMGRVALGREARESLERNLRQADPKVLAYNLLNSFYLIRDIASSTRFLVDQLESYKVRRPTKILFWAILFASLVIFFAVILPIFFTVFNLEISRIFLQLFSLWIPLVFYLTVLMYIVYKTMPL
ncbi:MAG: hypothetical protein A2145_02400 [candidate division Zixibacteria bacterium RBG_16_40_9]|nr:MAG: hypothetical protein A2145_02400 [candidate division Zixibacteria bacterium RBG_16_40_9]